MTDKPGKQPEDGRNDQHSEDDALRKALQTPISRKDAETAYADIDVERLKLLVIRQKWQAQVAQMTLQIQALDERLTALDLDRAVVFRRSLINPGEAENENGSEENA